MDTKLIKEASKDLPYEIIFDILARLRVKTLCKLRCVSKSWSALISDPAFVESHHRQCEQNPLLLVVTSQDPAYEGTRFCTLDKHGTMIDEFSLPISPHCRLRLASTCLDIVCAYDDNNVYVCNPATQDLTVLPTKSPPLDEHCRGIQCVSFGYLPSTNEFKVLHVFCRTSPFEGEEFFYEGCEVFTLGGGSNGRWRKVRSPPFQVLSAYPVTAPEEAFANGAIHVLPNNDTVRYSEGIARFDLIREKWSVLPLPPLAHIEEEEEAGNKQFLLRLGEVGGKLCLMDYGDENYWLVDLWMLKDYDSVKWEKTHSINLLTVEGISELVAREMPMVPIAIEEDGRILVELSHDRLQYFDLQGKKCGSEIRVGEKSISTSLYVESFRPLRRASRSRHYSSLLSLKEACFPLQVSLAASGFNTMNYSISRR